MKMENTQRTQFVASCFDKSKNAKKDVLTTMTLGRINDFVCSQHFHIEITNKTK